MNLKHGASELFNGLYECSTDGLQILIPSRVREIICEICGEWNALMLMYPNDCGGFCVVPIAKAQAENFPTGEVSRLDAKGKIRLPTALARLLEEGNTPTVMLVGLLDHLELWSTAAWEERIRQESEDFPVCDDLKDE